jgi:hypothetical protein
MFWEKYLRNHEIEVVKLRLTYTIQFSNKIK